MSIICNYDHVETPSAGARRATGGCALDLLYVRMSHVDGVAGGVIPNTLTRW